MHRHWTQQLAIVFIACIVGYATLSSEPALAALDTGGSSALPSNTGGSVLSAPLPADSGSKPSNQAQEESGPSDCKIEPATGKCVTTKDKCKTTDPKILKQCQDKSISCGKVTFTTKSGDVTCNKRKSEKKDCVPSTDPEPPKCKELAGESGSGGSGGTGSGSTGSGGNGSTPHMPPTGGDLGPVTKPPVTGPRVDYADAGGGTMTDGYYGSPSPYSGSGGTGNTYYPGMSDLAGGSNSGGYTGSGYDGGGSFYDQTSGGSFTPNSDLGSSWGNMSYDSSGAGDLAYETPTYNNDSFDTFTNDTSSIGEDIADTQGTNSAMPGGSGPFAQPVGDAFTPATPLKNTWAPGAPAPLSDLYVEDGKGFKLNESFLAEAEEQEKQRRELMQKILSDNQLSANPQSQGGDQTWTALSADPDLGSKVTVKIKVGDKEQEIEVDNVVWYDAAAQRASGRDSTLDKLEKKQEKTTVSVTGDKGTNPVTKQKDLPEEIFDNSHIRVSAGNKKNSFIEQAEESGFTRSNAPSAGSTATSDDISGSDQTSSHDSQFTNSNPSSGYATDAYGDTRYSQENTSSSDPEGSQYQQRTPSGGNGIFVATGHAMNSAWWGFVKVVSVVRHAWLWLFGSFLR